MIGRLKGVVESIDKDFSIIDVMGVGYITFCSARTLSNLPQQGEIVTLLIETHVREDSITLYGFLDPTEREWFKQLITVKGVGPRLALVILGSLTPERLTQALAARDKIIFTQISGVGGKLAERLITELKDKFVSSLEKITSLDSSNTQLESSSNDHLVQKEATSALINLGYNRLDAYNVVNKLLANNNHFKLGELIKLALRELSK